MDPIVWTSPIDGISDETAAGVGLEASGCLDEWMKVTIVNPIHGSIVKSHSVPPGSG